ncbi:MAG: PfkB family carbohydrate kinase [Pseudomonadota bacterium]
MSVPHRILCIGSVLWDVIGRAPGALDLGADRPGEITRVPGGVAMNIAVTLARFGLTPILLTAIGRDVEGDELLAAAADLGLETAHVHRSETLPTDTYMAIEGAGRLVAAIADARSLEAAGDAILAPLVDGPLGSAETPWTGPVALDGNLTKALLEDIAESSHFAAADLRVAPASPGKAERLRPFLKSANATLYLNLEEAGLLAGRDFGSSAEAAADLMGRGAGRVLVTNGGHPAADGQAGDVLTATPPAVPVARVTGAGDTFMAAHIAEELAGSDRAEALGRALDTAAAYVAKGGAP